MSVDIGIIGLPKSGKTAIFNGLTRGKGGAPLKGTSAHVGVATVPDPRLGNIAALIHPKKIVPTEVRYIDLGSSARDESISGQLLNQVSATDAIINVVRAFRDDSIPHPKGSIDIDRDIAAINLELAFSDMAIIERRQGRINDSLKGAKATERQALLKEMDTLAKLKEELEKGTPVRESDLASGEPRIMSDYQFLTAKPLLILVNIGEDQLPQATSLEESLNARYGRNQCRVIALCGKLEAELAQLDDAAAAEFRAGYGIAESGLDRVIRISYELLGLISFFSTASGEVRAWPIPRGTEAVKAAGKIHSDMERGFIRAEVISLADLQKCGGFAEARKQGVLRLEGKSYMVRDGDVITFLFNV